MKKLISCLLLLCLLLSLCGTGIAADADTSISILSSAAEREAGESVTFTFVLNNPGRKAVEGVKFSVAASAGLLFQSAAVSDKVSEKFLYSNYTNDTFNAVVGDNVKDTTLELLSVTYTVAAGTPAGAVLPAGIDRTKEVLVFMTVQSGSGGNSSELTCDVTQAYAGVTVIQCSGGHSMDGGSVTKQPSCTEPGEKTFTCTVCGFRRTETIPPLGHTAGETRTENEIPATCTEQGSYDEVSCCVLCGAEIRRKTVAVCSLGHDWGDWEIIEPATEDQEGLKRRTCRNDESHTEEKAVPPLAHQHTPVLKEEVPATCTEPGMSAHWECSGCGSLFAEENGQTEVQERDVILPAAGHAAGEQKETAMVSPTCTDSGYRNTVSECSVCGAACETTTENIPARGHVPGEPVTENVIPGTAESTGSHEEAVYCSVCGQELSRDLIADPADAPVIIGHPAETSVLAGKKASFKVSAIGNDLSYQWQESRDGGSTWTTCTENGSQTYMISFTALAKHLGRLYRCLVSAPDSAGPVISGAGRLTVEGAQITQQPRDVAVEEGDRATFTVKASGTSLKYRWQVSGDDGKTWTDCTESGSDTNTLSLYPRAASSGWRYRCRITGSGLTALTEAALLTVSVPKNKPLFKSQSLVLSGEIGVNFYMDLSALSAADRKSSYMVFSVGGASSAKVPFDSGKKNSKGYYGFTCYVKSIQMADTITAVLHYGNGKTVAREYSVIKYIEAVNGNAGNYNAKTLTLIRAIADYGHYAQIYLAEVNGWTIGDSYAEMSLFFANTYNYAEILSKVQANTFVKSISGSNVTKASYKLHLDSETTVDVFLTTKDGTAPKNVTLTVLEEETGEETTKTVVPEKQSDGRYMIRISGISAHRLGDMMTISGTAGKMFTIQVSGLSYVRSVLSSTASTEAAKNCLSSLYAYYAAIMAYRE